MSDHTVKILWADENVMSEYTFGTIEELKAFLLGVDSALPDGQGYVVQEGYIYHDRFNMHSPSIRCPLCES